MPFHSHCRGIYLQRQQLEREERKGREREEDHDQRGLKSTGITVEMKEGLSHHEGKINQTHLVMTEGGDAGITDGDRSLESTAIHEGCRREESQS